MYNRYGKLLVIPISRATGKFLPPQVYTQTRRTESPTTRLVPAIAVSLYSKIGPSVRITSTKVTPSCLRTSPTLPAYVGWVMTEVSLVGAWEASFASPLFTSTTTTNTSKQITSAKTATRVVHLTSVTDSCVVFTFFTSFLVKYKPPRGYRHTICILRKIHISNIYSLVEAFDTYRDFISTRSPQSDDLDKEGEKLSPVIHFLKEV